MSSSQMAPSTAGAPAQQPPSTFEATFILPPPPSHSQPPQSQPSQPQPQPSQPQPSQPQPQPQPQPQAAATGASPGPALIAPSPPEYSEVTKNPQQPVQQNAIPVQQGAVPVQRGFIPVQQGPVPVQQGPVPVQQGAVPVQYVQQPSQPQYMYMPGAQPGVQTAPYMVQTPFQPLAFPRPNYPGPHDFLILSVISTTVLALLNISSLVFGIPAIIFSIQSKDRKDNVDYPAAKQYANVSLGLIITNISYVLGSAVLAVGLSLGIYCRGYYAYYC